MLHPFPIKLPATLSITQTELDKGHRKCPKLCPTAHAWYKLLDEKEYTVRVRMDHTEVFSINKPESWAVNHPPELEEWIKNFDELAEPTDIIEVPITEDLIH